MFKEFLSDCSQIAEYGAHQPLFPGTHHRDLLLPFYERFREAILVGQLERGARLPSTRQLASELGVSRTTTALAYEQLLLEGYLERRVEQGTTVTRHLPTTLLQGRTGQTREKRAGAWEESSLPLASHVRPLQEVPSLEHAELRCATRSI